MAFTLYEIEDAPAPASKELEKSKAAFGFVPNLHKVLAASPQTLEGYKALHTLFQASSFNNTELTVVWQTFNYYHQCHYCLPAHTGIAHMMKVETTLIEALHNGEVLQDKKLATLQATAKAIVDQRGVLSAEQLDDFKAVGYGEQQLLEIILGLAQKTISNFANHLANTPVDEPFKEFVK
ncbi:MAG: carboxymuconolactone decarboxylase family protein [Kangiellaceae bacterium]|nr:carboxymuconolactone decarboxylase family protein [Kangiellaceae bacterium]